jgi:DNA-binding MarR family transcriptional regulator
LTQDQVSLGPALRRAWVGYQQRLDEAMARAGFADRGFPDGRVLRMCVAPAETTIADIGRELGITRQGAAKVVGGLRDRKYVTVAPSATNGREKIVRATPRAVAFLAAHRTAARSIERALRAELGEGAFAALEQLVDALAGEDDLSMRDYVRKAGVREL